MRKPYWYCTCGKNSIEEVEVDEDGVCSNCGYYAIACHQKVKTRNDLYNVLRLERTPVENHYIGSSAVEEANSRQEWAEALGQKASNILL